MICLEDCLRRIAVRLCQLEAADRSHGDSLNGPGNVKVDDRYKPPTDVKDVCADACCKPTAGDKDDCADEKVECAYTCCEINSQDAFTEKSPTCSEHLQVAFARFEPLIRQGQCLCRRLMSEMSFCCCSPDSTLCESHIEDKKRAPAQPNECGTDLISKTSRAIAARYQGNQKLPKAAVVEVSREDAETAAAREQVVLNVAGMTCTGCSKKLMNVLDGISGILNPKVTFVSGTASFELGNYVEKKEVDAVLSLIEKQTGFKVSRIVSDYQHVDVLIEPSIAQQLERESMNGFVSVEKVSLLWSSRCRIDLHHCLRFVRHIKR